MADQTPAKGEERRRRTERVLLRIPIEVKGTAADGEPFNEKTFTLVVNRDGARIGLKTLLRPNDRLSITNLQNRVCCPFRVVERATDTLGDGLPEFGVECLEPDVNVWGINFPRKMAAPAKEEMVDALLECSRCKVRELAQLTLEQYRGLISQSSVDRDCGKCAARTNWVFGFVEAEPDEAAAAAPDPASSSEGGGIERRRAKRVTVKLPVRLRLDDGRDEVARTENLSKTGVCFASDLDLKRGDALKVTVGYAAGANAAEIKARVVWRRPMEGTTAHALYGVRLEEETS
jgi:hypothetical protein